MAQKRRSEDADTSTNPSKKAKRGFNVGPTNLPDGSYKRKGLLERTLAFCLDMLTLKQLRKSGKA